MGLRSATEGSVPGCVGGLGSWPTAGPGRGRATLRIAGGRDHGCQGSWQTAESARILTLNRRRREGTMTLKEFRPFCWAFTDGSPRRLPWRLPAAAQLGSSVQG